MGDYQRFLKRHRTLTSVMVWQPNKSSRSILCVLECFHLIYHIKLYFCHCFLQSSMMLMSCREVALKVTSYMIFRAHVLICYAMGEDAKWLHTLTV
jgi:hypothetical protein